MPELLWPGLCSGAIIAPSDSGPGLCTVCYTLSPLCLRLREGSRLPRAAQLLSSSPAPGPRHPLHRVVLQGHACAGLGCFLSSPHPKGKPSAPSSAPLQISVRLTSLPLNPLMCLGLGGDEQKTPDVEQPALLWRSHALPGHAHPRPPHWRKLLRARTGGPEPLGLASWWPQRFEGHWEPEETPTSWLLILAAVW